MDQFSHLMKLPMTGFDNILELPSLAYVLNLAEILICNIEFKWKKTFMA